jgi:murein DD-endopeptidase MepM/ murein hydrolase activator NlpD
LASRQWTVLVLPDDHTATRQFSVSRARVRTAVGLALAVTGGIAMLAITLFASGAQVHGDARLMAKNAMLEHTVEEMAARMVTLEGGLDRLAAQDEFYRLLAGLEPLDADVLLAGIGGPDADPLEERPLYRIDEDAGRRAFSVTSQLDAMIRRANVLSSSWGEARDELATKHGRLRATPSIAPVRGYVSSSFSSSRLHPLLHRARPHVGIDIVAREGTPVIATAAGRVTAAGRQGDYGMLVEIDHGHGMVTRYAHLSRTSVKAGQVVERGQDIGAVGTTGLSTGPHLHYEVLINGRHTNPRRHILDLDALP